MIDYLNQHFVNIWVLLDDMKRMAKARADSPERRFAKMVVREYDFPVIAAVVAPGSSRLLGKKNLNRMLNQGTRRTRPGLMEQLLGVSLLFARPYNAQAWARRRRREMDFGFNMDRMEYQYLRFLWQTARRHNLRFAPPPRIRYGKAVRPARR